MKFKKPKFWDLKKQNLISYLLLPLTLAVVINNFFLKFKSKKKDKNIKTICVGNIYLGGTGKTSLTIEINNILKKSFKTIFIKKKYINQLDEIELLKTYGNVFSDNDRKISLIKAENTRKYNLAILDDGLQDKTIKYDARYGNGMCSSDFNLFKTNSNLKKVEKDLTNIMESQLKSEVYIIDSFFNILKSGSGTTPHNHVNQFDKNSGLIDQKYSLTYYLSIGDQNSNEPGILKLYEPGHEILPEKGMIVIIPASRKHSAVYDGKKDRVMIGINFYTLV